MNQNQFDALLSATYNHGNVNNCPLKYYLQGKLNASDARSQYLEWCINKGTSTENGLRARRKKEADLFFSNSSPILPAPINNRNYDIPATVYASHKIYTYNEYGSQESNRYIAQNDKCYIDAVYVNDYVHVKYPTGGSSEPNRWTYAKLSDFTDVIPIIKKSITLHAWISDSKMGGIPEKLYTGQPFYLCYELIYSDTKERISGNLNYSVKETIKRPDGSVAHEYSYDNSNNNWIGITPNKSGKYEGTVVASGDINITVNVSTNIYDKAVSGNLSLDKSTVSLDLCGTNTATVKITVSGNLPSSYRLRANRDTSAMETSWGEWSGSTAPINIKGKKTGTYDLKISIIDSNTDQTLTTKTITVNISCSHSYSSWSTTKQPTCTADGTQERKCSVCGKTETQTIKATGHNYTTTVIRPTCTEQGYTQHTCSKCSYSYKDNYTSATGHSFGSWTATKSPTCTTEGTKQRKCSACGKTETQTIPATGHSYTTSVIRPTCTDQGYTVHYCSRCSSSYTDNYTSATGHSFGSWTTTKQPTCTADGTKQRKCSDCGKTETQTIPATGHSYKTTVKEPTYTEQGYTLHTCSKCGYSYKDNYTDVLVNPLVNQSTISKNSTSVGGSIIVTAKASGGSGGYKYAVSYKKSTDSSWSEVSGYSTTNSVTVKIPSAGSYTIRVHVKDSKGTIKNKDFNVTINAALANTSKVSATSITKGKTVTVTCASTGGTGTKKYAVWYKLSSASSWTKVQDYSTTTTAKVTPSATGKYTVRVAVKDGEGTIKNKDFTVTIIAALTNTSKISSTEIKLGSTVKITCSATGSTGFYQYAVLYKTSSSDKWTTKQDYSSNSSVTFSPKSLPASIVSNSGSR